MSNSRYSVLLGQSRALRAELEALRAEITRPQQTLDKQIAIKRQELARMRAARATRYTKW